MKRVIAWVLVLMALCSSAALAFDPARFEGLEGFEVTYDEAEPLKYAVMAGFADKANWTESGGRLLIRYKNLGKAEEIPLILASFTSTGLKAVNMSVRTDAHRYQVLCTDLAGAGLNAIDSEGVVMLTQESFAMLSDIAESAYVEVRLWEDDPGNCYAFLPDAGERARLRPFLEEYEAEVAPLVFGSISVKKVYDRLTPVVTVEDAADISEAATEAMSAEYVTLKNGSSGEAVRELQQMLIDLGHLKGKADGIFGKMTQSAVKSFQKAEGLSATGVADADTQRSMKIALAVKE